MLRRAIVTAAVVSLLASTAYADRADVALVAPDRALLDAAQAALIPWQIRVIAVSDGAPGADMPAAARRARAIALAHGVGAVVWISRAEAGAALWMYDTDGDRTVARALTSAPPFDDATAAAVALSIKTLLRHSAVAPARARYAATPTTRRPRLRIESTLGGRLRPGIDGLEPRLGLGAEWSATDWLAVALAVRSGPGVAVDEAGFVGRLSDTAAAVGARARRALGGRFAAVGDASAVVHVTDLDGAVLTPEQRTHVRRTNPALELGAGVEWHALPELSIGLRATGGYVLRSQRYLVRDEPVLELPATEWTTTVVIRTGVF